MEFMIVEWIRDAVKYHIIMASFLEKIFLFCRLPPI